MKLPWNSGRQMKANSSAAGGGKCQSSASLPEASTPRLFLRGQVMWCVSLGRAHLSSPFGLQSPPSHVTLFGLLGQKLSESAFPRTTRLLRAQRPDE